MIEYIISHSPDDRVLQKASDILAQGGLVCFPTDSNWTFAACAQNKVGTEKLYKMKKEGKQKHFSLLCDSISMASDVALIDNQSFRLLKKTIPGHYTFIFEATKKVAKLIQASKTDKEIGLRFVPSDFVNKLIDKHGQALMCTNVTNEMLGLAQGSSEDIYSYLIEDKLSHCIDMIIDPGEFEFTGETSIIDFTSGVPEIIRTGSGDTSFFI